MEKVQKWSQEIRVDTDTKALTGNKFCTKLLALLYCINDHHTVLRRSFELYYSL